VPAREYSGRRQAASQFQKVGAFPPKSLVTRNLAARDAARDAARGAMHDASTSTREVKASACVAQRASLCRRFHWRPCLSRGHVCGRRFVECFSRCLFLVSSKEEEYHQFSRSPRGLTGRSISRRDSLVCVGIGYRANRGLDIDQISRSNLRSNLRRSFFRASTKS
jgi:hypothetical protein